MGNKALKAYGDALVKAVDTVGTAIKPAVDTVGTAIKPVTDVVGNAVKATGVKMSDIIESGKNLFGVGQPGVAPAAPQMPPAQAGVGGNWTDSMPKIQKLKFDKAMGKGWEKEVQ